MIEFCLVDAVVIHPFAGKMLTEAVITEEDIVTGHIGKHRIRPVEHGRFNEYQLTVAQIQGIARFDVDVIPILVIQPAKNGFAFLGTVNGNVGDFPHQSRQCPTVVIFIMIHDDVIDFIQVDFLF